MTLAKKRTPKSIVFNTNSPDLFPPITLGASVVSTTVQARYILPCSAKCMGVISYASAVGATLPLSNLFNIAIGEGAYQTGATAVACTTALTVAAPSTGNVLTISLQIPGTAPTPVFFYTVKSTDTTATILANSMVAAWNQTIFAVAASGGIPLNKLVGAWNQAGAGTINFTFLYTTPVSNGVILVGSSSGTTTITASATFAGGAASTGITIPPTDTVETNAVYNFGSLGQALFSSDKVIGAAAPGAFGVFYEVDAWDSILAQGTNLTLRATTGVGAAVTNWNVGLIVVPYDPQPTKPELLAGIPGAPFSPARVIY